MYGPRSYTPATHRFFDEAATLFVNLASFNAATESFWNSSSTSIPTTPNHTLTLMGRVAHASFPVHDLMHGVVRNNWPAHLPLVLQPSNTEPNLYSNGVQLQSGAVANMIVQMVGTAFLRYYERNAQRPKTAFPAGPKTWPELWRFAWLLRNAIAHADTWSLNDLSFPSTSWHGVGVSPRDSGSPWFDLNRFIGGGDVLLLLEELDASSV